MAKARDLDDIPAGYGNSDRKKPSDVVELFVFPDDKYVRMRAFPGVFSYGGHWVKASPKKNAEGKAAKSGGKGGGSFYQVCAAWDADNGVRRGGNGKDHCAWCALEAQEKNLEQDEQHSRFSVDHYMNAIIRSFQKTGPGEGSEEPTKKEQKSGFKDKESETWTPVRPVRFTGGVARQIKDLKQLNLHEDESGDTVASAVSDLNYGCDLMIMKSPGKPAAQMYSVQKGDASIIKKAEKNYLQWDLSSLTDPITTEDSYEEFESWAERSGVSLEAKKGKKSTSEDDDEEEMPKAKKKAKVVDEEDDDDIPVAKSKAKKPVVEEDEEEEDEEEETPPPKKKAKAKIIEEDEEEEEAPPPKAKKKVKVVDDDEFDDEDEPPKKTKKPVLVDDDEEDPPPKKKAKAKVIEEEDEEEDPPPKAKKKVKVVEEDDEDDVPPPKKKAKKKVVDEEEDDDGL